MSNPTHAAPLPRAWLDTIATPIRVFFGMIFVAWSWISTVLILGPLLAPVVVGAAVPGIGTRFVIAFGFALMVSLAEFVCSGRWPVAYWLVLLFLDASFTTYQTRTWLVAIVAAQTDIQIVGHVAIWILSGIGGIIAGKFGELLLFGSHKG